MFRMGRLLWHLLHVQQVFMRSQPLSTVAGSLIPRAWSWFASKQTAIMTIHDFHHHHHHHQRQHGPRHHHHHSRHHVSQQQEQEQRRRHSEQPLRQDVPKSGLAAGPPLSAKDLRTYKLKQAAVRAARRSGNIFFPTDDAEFPMFDDGGPLEWDAQSEASETTRSSQYTKTTIDGSDNEEEQQEFSFNDTSIFNFENGPPSANPLIQRHRSSHAMLLTPRTPHSSQLLSADAKNSRKVSAISMKSPRPAPALPLRIPELPQTTCPVCLDDLHSDTAPCSLLRLPCHHVYHYRCLTPWFQLHYTCPVCKFNILYGGYLPLLDEDEERALMVQIARVYLQAPRKDQHRFVASMLGVSMPDEAYAVPDTPGHLSMLGGTDSKPTERHRQGPTHLIVSRDDVAPSIYPYTGKMNVFASQEARLSTASQPKHPYQYHRQQQGQEEQAHAPQQSHHLQLSQGGQSNRTGQGPDSSSITQSTRQNEHGYLRVFHSNTSVSISNGDDHGGHDDDTLEFEGDEDEDDDELLDVDVLHEQHDASPSRSSQPHLQPPHYGTWKTTYETEFEVISNVALSQMTNGKEVDPSKELEPLSLPVTSENNSEKGEAESALSDSNETSNHDGPTASTPERETMQVVKEDNSRPATRLVFELPRA
eukprot:m.176008 g.176008  ORF g.176008 m.176008 type:complete len:647 (+) comp16552_c16_seq2:702-2642(+)